MSLESEIAETFGLVGADMAELFRRLGAPSYGSRLAVQAAKVPAPVTLLRAGGLNYRRDMGGGVALVSADGARWSPEGVASPEHFGDIGSDFTGCLKRLMEWLATQPAPRSCELPSGSYPLTETITIPSDVTIFARGTLLDMSQCAPGSRAFRTGGLEGDRYPLTSDALMGTFQTTMAPADLAASGITPGTWVRLTSNAIFDPGMTNSRVGEMAQVRSVNPATGNITFGTPIGADGGSGAAHPSVLADSYRVSEGATISNLNVVRNIHLLGACCIKSAANPSLRHIAIEFGGSVGCSSNWTGTLLDNIFLRLIDTTQFSADGVYVSGMLPDTSGYGVSFAGATQDVLVSNIRGFEVRHLVSTNNPTANPGIPRRIVVNGFVSMCSRPATGGSTAGGDAIDTHAAAEHITYMNGQIINSSGQGVNVECPTAKLINVDIHNAGSRGLGMVNRSGREGQYYVRGVRIFTSGVRDPAFDAAYIGTDDRFAGTLVRVDAEITVVGSTRNGIVVTGSVGRAIRHLRLAATVEGYSGNGGLLLSYIDQAQIIAPDLRGAKSTTVAAIKLTACNNMVISSMTAQAVEGFSGYLIDILGSCSRINIFGCSLLGPSSPSGTAIMARTGATGITEALNNITGFATTKSGF